MMGNFSLTSGDIRIDKDGIWYYRGAEMFRKDIVNLLYINLKIDDHGRYLIEFNNDRCYLDVEDTPYVIKAVYRSFNEVKEKDAINLLLPDDSLEELDPSTLSVNNDNILYCYIKRLNCFARFSRASYYQIVQYVDHDPVGDRYYILLNGNYYYISKEEKRLNSSE
jgi:uncharacterized protein